MRILVLDDEEVRHEQFAVNLTGHSVVHVRTTEEAGHALAQEKFDLVYLDHDLHDFARNPNGYGQIEQTGFDVARFIARYLALQKRPDKVVVHSWNPPGARQMVEELREAGIPVTHEPFNSESGSKQTQIAPAGPWVTVATPNDMTPEDVKKIRDQFQASIGSITNSWRTPIFTDEPTNLAELKEQFDEMVEKMQTPEAREAARSLFTATPEELGEAAVRGAKRDAVEAESLDENEENDLDGPMCDGCLDDSEYMMEECDQCFAPLCQSCHYINYGICSNCDPDIDIDIVEDDP